jgi:hypothetical protein
MLSRAEVSVLVKNDVEPKTIRAYPQIDNKVIARNAVYCPQNFLQLSGIE